MERLLRGLWRQAWANTEREPADDDLCFTYWDTYHGAQPDLSGVAVNARVVRLLDRAAANALSNKASLARSIKRAGLDHLAPPSYERVDEAIDDNPPGTIWFVKPIFGTAGKGMYCVSSEALSELELPEHSILQKEVDNPLLDDGRKSISRVHVLVWNGEVRMFETGMTVTHGVPYRSGSTDYRVQIDHRGFNDDSAAVQVRPGHRKATFVDHFPALRRLVRELRPILAGCVNASDRDRYLLLGIDTVICRDGTPRLLEINSFPNFVHTPEVNNEVNVPLFESTIRTITGDSRETQFGIVPQTTRA